MFVSLELSKTNYCLLQTKYFPYITLITKSGFPNRMPLIAANMSADVLPKASNVTPAMFWDKPRVFDIMKRAGHRLEKSIVEIKGLILASRMIYTLYSTNKMSINNILTNQ